MRANKILRANGTLRTTEAELQLKMEQQVCTEQLRETSTV